MSDNRFSNLSNMGTIFSNEKDHWSLWQSVKIASCRSQWAQVSDFIIRQMIVYEYFFSFTNLIFFLMFRKKYWSRPVFPTYHNSKPWTLDVVLCMIHPTVAGYILGRTGICTLAKRLREHNRVSGIYRPKMFVPSPSLQTFFQNFPIY